ncbi:unnamed protein product, partial [Rotaria sp. Silwood1]
MFSVYHIDKIEKLLGVPSAWVVHITLQLEKMNLTKLGYTIMNRLHLFKSTNKLFKEVLYDSP